MDRLARRFAARLGTTALVSFAFASCATTPLLEGRAPVVVPEQYLVDDYRRDNVDSLAVWPRQNWLLATAKATDRLLIFDAADGRSLDAVTGTAAAPLDRPNGIAVHGDLLFVVERDNHRVAVFSLPEKNLVATFGEDLLIKPYGLALLETAPGKLRVYVTDDFELVAAPGGRRAGKLDERVRVFGVTIDGARIEATPEAAFGAAEGAGVLHVVESVAVDPAADVVLLADEFEENTLIKVYDRAGRFTGKIVGEGLFFAQAEGIALFECGSGGYWVTTDQDKRRTRFLLFDRQDFAFKGAFTGAKTANTDGITVVSQPIGPFSEGAIFAVHNDRGVAAFDWKVVREALGLSCR